MDRQQIDNSSNMQSAGYDPDTQKMHVEFKNGNVYEYDGVTPEEWSGMAATINNEDASPGKYFGQTFRGKHDFNQI